LSNPLTHIKYHFGSSSCTIFFGFYLAVDFCSLTGFYFVVSDFCLLTFYFAGSSFGAFFSSSTLSVKVTFDLILEAS